MLWVLATETVVVAELITMEECGRTVMVQVIKNTGKTNQLVCFPRVLLLCLSVGIFHLPPIGLPPIGLPPIL